MTEYKTVKQDYATLPGGAKIPVVGLGTWKSKPSKSPAVEKQYISFSHEVEQAVETALRVGYRHIDCADAYSNHAEVGRAFKKVFTDKNGPKREDVWITTKLHNDNHEPSEVKSNIERFLKELQLDYLDCVLIHWPYQSGCKGRTLKPPYKDTWQALEKVVDEGLVKYIGVSNLSVKKFQDLLTYNKHPVVINQVEINPYWRNDKLVDFAREKGLHLTAYSPFASPDSAEEMGNQDRPKLLEDPVLNELAKKYKKSPGQEPQPAISHLLGDIIEHPKGGIRPVFRLHLTKGGVGIAVRWGVQHGTTVLPKSVTPSRIEDNLHVFDFELSPEDYKRLSSFKDQGRYLVGKLALDSEGPYRTPEELWDGEV